RTARWRSTARARRRCGATARRRRRRWTGRRADRLEGFRVLSFERHQMVTGGGYELSNTIDNHDMANPACQTLHQTAPMARRRAAMTVLADASAAEIGRGMESVRASLGALPAHETIRAPECGLVMVQGRVGGDGAPFNVGEATVSRAAVRLESGETG